MLQVPKQYVHFRTLAKRRYRYAQLPNTHNNLQIVFVNGHHSNIERVYPLLKYLQGFGTVYCPDLPGFGQSEPFRRRRPSLKLEAEFLGIFVKKHVKPGPFIVVGVSMGFMVATLCLQNYRSLRQQCRGVINVSGFLESSSLRFSATRLATFRRVSAWLGRKWIARPVQKHLVNRGWLMRGIIERKLIDQDYQNFPVEHKIIAREFELQLWRENDLYTHFSTLNDILNLRIVKPQLPMPLYAIFTTEDKYIKPENLQESFQKVYPDCHITSYGLKGHAPVYVASMADYKRLIPPMVVDFLQQESDLAKKK